MKKNFVWVILKNFKLDNDAIESKKYQQSEKNYQIIKSNN